MRKEFLVERSGKTFALYAGLLDQAHTDGLTSITTELIQIPDDGNGRVAICKATVTLEKDGRVRMFTGLGDAAPENVARPMVTCLLRMAETRSKARALRDAVNVGVAAMEELDDFEEEEGEVPSRQRPANVTHISATRETIDESAERAFGNAPSATATQTTTKPAAKSTAQSAPASGGPVATDAQVRAIYAIARNQVGWQESQTDEHFVARYGVKPSELTRRNASEAIDALQKGEWK